MPRAEVTDAGVFGLMKRYGDLCIHAVLDLNRAFSRDELELAVSRTIGAFPVLGHRYRPGLWRDRWEPVETPLSTCVHLHRTSDVEAATERWVRRTLVPTEERQLRVVALPTERGIRLILSVLHLAVDGAGIAAIGHVFGAHLYGLEPSLPVERRRDLPRALDRLGWLHAPLLAKEVLRAAAQPLRHLVAAPRTRAYADRSATEPGMRHFVVPRATLERLRATCPPGASVNDLLLGALARASAARSKDGPVVVTYTMDLRRFGAEPRLMATNASTILSLVVPREATVDLPSAVGAVRELTSSHRTGLAGPAFLAAPYALGVAAPHALARRLVGVIAPVVADLPFSRGLAVTNIGRVDDGLKAFGDDLESLRIYGPNHHRFSAPLVVAFGFRGALHLHVFASPSIGAAGALELEAELKSALDLIPGAPLASPVETKFPREQ
ncbi:MAG: hypothetical protein IPM79_21490 [Polyangiaceae bacterium]|nr:hypothetical protein [Polyangiaceae bacterium]